MKLIKNFKFKTFITVLILIFNFQIFSKADDIKEFEIEELSIGISALKFFSKNELELNLSNPPNLENTIFNQSCFDNFSDTYDRMCVSYKKKSSKKIIDLIQGQIIYEGEAYNACRSNQKKIDKELSLLFANLERVDWGKLMLTAINHLDPDAYYYPITYEFTDGSRAQVGCYYINDHTRLKVGVYTYEYGQVIKN